MSPAGQRVPLRAADVERLLAAHFHADGAARGRVEGPRLASAKTRIFYAEWPGLPSPLAIKEVRLSESSESAAAEARLQFEAMERAAAAFIAEGPFCVPRPIALLAEACLLVMEWLPGQPLSALLMGWDSPLAANLEHLGRSGAWLARLHAAGELPAGEIETDRVLAKLAPPLGRLRAAGADRPVLGRAARLLERTAAALGGVPVSRSWIHGDFKPHNVMVTPDRTTGFDLRLDIESSSLPDLANFLNHLDLMCYRPRGLRMARRCGALQAAFLAGYTGAGRAVPPAHLLWLRLDNLIHQWARCAPDRCPGLRGRYQRICCERLAGALVAELDGALRHGAWH